MCAASVFVCCRQGLAPVAFLLSPSKMNLPVDLALGVMLPLHGESDFDYIQFIGDLSFF